MPRKYTDDEYADMLNALPQGALPGRYIKDPVTGESTAHPLDTLLRGFRREQGNPVKPNQKLMRALARHGLVPTVGPNGTWRLPKLQVHRTFSDAQYAAALRTRPEGNPPTVRGEARLPGTDETVSIGTFVNNLRREGRKKELAPELVEALQYVGLTVYRAENGWYKVKTDDPGKTAGSASSALARTAPADAPPAALPAQHAQPQQPAGTAARIPADAPQESNLPQIGAIQVYLDYQRALPALVPEVPPPGLKVAMHPEAVAPASDLDVIVTTIDFDRTSTQPVPPFMQGVTFLADPGLNLEDPAVCDQLEAQGFLGPDRAIAEALQQRFYQSHLARASSTPGMTAAGHHPVDSGYNPIAYHALARTPTPGTTHPTGSSGPTQPAHHSRYAPAGNTLSPGAGRGR
ncbi:hypothetical protein SUDANB145_05202 [Streptomyces sp. enrichment culture]|uniref:hypothetical protein n=1 Tax=Streptomyces sp. enrichment culture TaxID=1795815 RepID=UPI003F559280